MDHSETSFWRRVAADFGWTRSSYFLISLFLATIAVIGVVWWPLLRAELAYIDWDRPLWGQVDWLLLGLFALMSLLITAGADVRADVLIAIVGLIGGLVIESWGTQTHLWDYYTMERPPFWIIPAWPIASLSVDRLVRLLHLLLPWNARKVYVLAYWPLFIIFYVLMLQFVWPTVDKSLTVMALILCAFLISTPTDHRMAVLTFVAAAGLGYFLELWGTTRYCWTYYTRETPPLFAVLAHGMASVSFWRVTVLARVLLDRLELRDVRHAGRRRVDRVKEGGS
ncbi:MAG: hypothetical protein GX620_10080 [Chloroflexi bacterium]|nr:hypothetical protein [Chloroflexota bacterium]